MAIDYENRPTGTSKREYKAEQTGGTLNYDTGKITGGTTAVKIPTDIYSGDNVLKSMTSPLSRPDYSQYNIDVLNKNLLSSIEALNKYDLNTEKSLAKINTQDGLGLEPMGRQARVVAENRKIERTGYANQVDAYTNALSAARTAYNDAMTQYNSDRDYDLDVKKMNQPTTAETLGTILSNTENELLKSKGADGFVDPSIYRSKKQEFISNGGESEDFDSEFSYLLSQNERLNLGISSGGSVDEWVSLLSRGQATIANVPQAIRNEVVSKVASTGAEINKQLSDTAITEITQTQSALSGLDELADKIRGNEEYIGPISGLARFNPYSKARQIQSDVDRIRQVVGKALEGGVLRKEDEEKYKKILATLSDTPDTALYKIEALKSSLERDIADYKATQAQAGRYVEGVSGVNADDLRTKYNY